MDTKTVKALNSLNQKFYQTVYNEFDTSRQKAWDGWLELLPIIWQLPDNPRALDLGCGNGRFGEFLEENLLNLSYTGMDQDDHLIASAKRRVASGTFYKGDLLKAADISQISGSFDFISLIAVLHHIPSLEARKQLLTRVVKKIKPGGYLLFTAWQFLEIQALKSRVIEWKNYPDIDIEQIEKNDYLLDWQRGQHAVRYCHWIDRKEIEELTAPLSLTKVDQFYADGKEGMSNIYVVLQK